VLDNLAKPIKSIFIEYLVKHLNDKSTPRQVLRKNRDCNHDLSHYGSNFKNCQPVVPIVVQTDSNSRQPTSKDDAL
jgi:hypothetical protein